MSQHLAWTQSQGDSPGMSFRSIKEISTILLTTHHGWKADVLGDRIAIMAKGTLPVLWLYNFPEKFMVCPFDHCLDANA